MRVEVVAVQDGDSLIVRPMDSRSGREMRVRLFAIDAPERGQKGGGEAREYLRQLVAGRTDLMLDPVHTDQYRRQVAVLYYRRAGRRRSVNRMMVEQGLARWYSSYGGRELGLEQAERAARRHRRGLWAARGHTAPWEHRRVQRQAAARRERIRWILMGAGIALAAAAAGYVWLNPP